MANPIIVPKKSVISKIPQSSDLASGEICINHADKKLYAKHPATGAIQEIGGGSFVDTRFWSFGISGDYLYLGSISASESPATGSIYDVTTWNIDRTLTNAAGDIISESTATGAWSNKTNLTYS